MSGQPYLKFYPNDWQSDECVALLTLAARGLWMEMLLIMHKGGGYLTTNGQPLTVALLARMVRADISEVEGLVAELEGAGVFSRDEQGTIYSRRILRDIAKAEADRVNGKLGGNPRLRNGVNPPNNPPVKRRVKSGLREGDNTHGARPESTSDFLTEEVDRARRGRADDALACGSVASPPADQETELQIARRKLEKKLASQPAHLARILAGSKTANNPLAYLKGCSKEKIHPPPDEPPDKPPDCATVPSRFVRQDSPEWQALKKPIVTMHHGNAGTWVRSA